MSEDTTHDIIRKVINDNLDYLVRFTHFRVGSHSLAEDIVHDAIVRFIERGAVEIPSSGLRLYLFRIVYNMCQDYLRQSKDAPLSLDTFDNDSLIDREELLDNEEAQRINSILASLPAHEAEIIRMRVVDELPFTDISDILGSPASTVKSRFKAGMDRLKRIYHNKPS